MPTPRDSGLFQNTHAMENAQEYWAEGVQDWYYTNLESEPPNGIQNGMDRREELLEYDPTQHGLIAEFLARTGELRRLLLRPVTLGHSCGKLFGDRRV